MASKQSTTEDRMAPLTRSNALDDLAAAGTRVEVIQHRVAAINRVVQLPPLGFFTEKDLEGFAGACLANDWRGLRKVGASGVIADYGDPQTLADLVTRNHDYPGEDTYFAMTTEG